MDRWTGIVKIPVYPQSSAHCRIAASLCISPVSKSLTVPTANAIFFHGDRVEGTGNPVIERLYDLQNIADLLVSKFGTSVNAWVIEASTFNGPYAIYKECIPSVNRLGEPQYYNPDGYPASATVTALLSNFLEEREQKASPQGHQPEPSAYSCPPKTIVLGFSKGGVVLNQLVSELGFAHLVKPPALPKSRDFSTIIPGSAETFLGSICEIHYVDVGLNSPGAYLTDDTVIKRITEQLIKEDRELHFMLHGTPRQWSDMRRAWIREEKDKLQHLLESQGQKSGGKLQVRERIYFAEQSPDLQMHFEIIVKLDVS